MSKTSLFLVLLVFFAAQVQAEPCIVDLTDEDKGIHVAVESCGDVGTFSIGGLYGGGWEKLTYNYPSPWKGSFISVKLDETVYSNSKEAQGKTSMDPYLVAGPEVRGDSIFVEWLLPGDIGVVEEFRLIENGVVLNLTVVNHGDFGVDSAVRFHIDTMLGENDGAPIYIPGDGLKSTEAEYGPESIDFRYWKAYNKIDNPSVLSTGMLVGERYPGRLVLANWKKSIYSAWSYDPDPEMSILGDSAVISYYDLGALGPGAVKSASFSYLNGEPILPTSKGYFGIAEIVTDEVEGIYCPGEQAEITVDVISRKEASEGRLFVEIKSEDGKTVYSEERNTGVVESDSVKNMRFTWDVPANISPTYFDFSSVLYDNSGKELDKKTEEILVDYTLCGGAGGPAMNWAILLIPLALTLSTVIIFIAFKYYAEQGEVELIKEKEGENVRVIAYNRKKQTVSGCVLIDRIAEGAEVDVATSGVKRRDTELIWHIGVLESGSKAILEYRIKDVEFLPPAVLEWDTGETVSP